MNAFITLEYNLGGKGKGSANPVFLIPFYNRFSLRSTLAYRIVDSNSNGSVY